MESTFPFLRQRQSMTAYINLICVKAITTKLSDSSTSVDLKTSNLTTKSIIIDEPKTKLQKNELENDKYTVFIGRNPKWFTENFRPFFPASAFENVDDFLNYHFPNKSSSEIQKNNKERNLKSPLTVRKLKSSDMLEYDLNDDCLPDIPKKMLLTVSCSKDLHFRKITQREKMQMSAPVFILMVRCSAKIPIYLRNLDEVKEVSIFTEENANWKILFVKKVTSKILTVGGRCWFVDLPCEAFMFYFPSKTTQFLNSIQKYLKYKWTSKNEVFGTEQLRKPIRGRVTNNFSEMINVSDSNSTTHMNQFSVSNKSLENKFFKHMEEKSRNSIDSFDKNLSKIDEKRKMIVKRSTDFQSKSGFPSSSLNLKKIKNAENENCFLNSLNEKNGEKFFYVKSFNIRAKWHRTGTIKAKSCLQKSKQKMQEGNNFWLIDIPESDREKFILKLNNTFNASKIELNQTLFGKCFFKPCFGWPMSNVFYIEYLKDRSEGDQTLKELLVLQKNTESYFYHFNLPIDSILFVFCEYSIEELWPENVEFKDTLEDKFLQIVGTNQSKLMKTIEQEELVFDSIDMDFL